jgi:hypothetical protein
MNKRFMTLSLVVMAAIGYLPNCSAFLGRAISAPFRIAGDAVYFAGDVAGAATDTALGLATLGLYQGDYYGYPSQPTYSYAPAPVTYTYAAPAAPVYVQSYEQPYYRSAPVSTASYNTGNAAYAAQPVSAAITDSE